MNKQLITKNKTIQKQKQTPPRCAMHLTDWLALLMLPNNHRRRSLWRRWVMPCTNSTHWVWIIHPPTSTNFLLSSSLGSIIKANYDMLLVHSRHPSHLIACPILITRVWLYLIILCFLSHHGFVSLWCFWCQHVGRFDPSWVNKELSSKM